jgi:Rad3-related DNA helicase
MPNFDLFDGSGRLPRPIQIDTLKKLNETWNDTDVHALLLPVATGKSALARSIQQATGADILTPSNLLVEQYSADYPAVNLLKGKTHYKCKSGLDCRTWQECGFEACPDCPYEKSKNRAIDGEPTFYNPMSYYYFQLMNRSSGSNILVVDEAHQLPSMVLMLCSKRLKRSDYKFTEKCCNEVYLVKWLKEQIDRLARLSEFYARQHQNEKLAKVKEEIETLTLLKKGLEEDGQNYVIWINKDDRDTYLNVKPLFPPRFLMNRIIGRKKLILMSGTLFDYDIRDIVGSRSHHTIEQNSPIPRENRRIVYRPAPFKINYQTDPKQLADYVQQFIEPGKNTLVHSTYSLSRKLCQHFPEGTIYNTSDDKDEKLAEFKQRGGVFLASGCAEGIDLKYDLCRTNIIPKLNFPDLNDPAVQKRKAMQDGDEWYCLETIKSCIQQSGRSTRAVDDFSTIYVLDPNFKRIILKYKHKIPKYFLESIEW